MLEEIRSRLNPNQVIHYIHRPGPRSGAFLRVDLIPSSEFLQAAWIEMPMNHTFPPHAHLWQKPERTEVIPQESWVVIRGRVECSLYDVDDSLLVAPILEAGDASFTIAGGHTYRALDPGTLVYEFKTGPYQGHQFDKRPLISP